MLIHHHNGRAQKVFITEIAMCSWHKKLFQPKLNTKKTLLTWNVKWHFTQKACLTENIRRMIITIKKNMSHSISMHNDIVEFYCSSHSWYYGAE